MNVAVIDYREGTAPAQFAESLRTTGFAVLVGHPLPVELVRQVQEEWLAFFGTEQKWSYLPEPGSQDGYHPLSASETALGAATPDIKEFFHWYPWGQHPAEVSGAADELHRQASALGTELLGWLEGDTPTEVSQRFPSSLSAMVDGSRRSLLRILRYPPLTGDEPAGSLRSAAHEDINLLTVLPAATHPGLQVRDRSGTWHDVPGDLGSVVVNGGDMLTLASGGYFPSTAHRVLLPSGEEGRHSRVSTPLFLQPADDVVLADGVMEGPELPQRALP
jgi:isopenicillin N synthase-like dioxygenase